VQPARSGNQKVNSTSDLRVRVFVTQLAKSVTKCTAKTSMKVTKKNI